MSTAHEDAIATGALAVVWLAVSIAAFARARHGGPRSQWRYVGLFGFVLCTALFVLNLNGVALHGTGPDHHSGSQHQELNP